MHGVKQRGLLLKQVAQPFCTDGWKGEEETNAIFDKPCVKVQNCYIIGYRHLCAKKRTALVQ
uniref:Uncharacterized protein n=1 Tax=Anguilla anguilla TaxID=7936 RepID=A0A0E9X0T2_ANGAN